jgi:hypothetical protein
VDVAAQRYLQAATFGPEVSGEFHASAPGKVSGPLQVMKHPHFHDRASQDAAWKAVVNVSGVPFPARASHLQVSRLAAECPPLPPAAVG